MSGPGVIIAAPHFLLLLAGALLGYLLLMATNPVRASFADGGRAIRRYRALWITLGCLGFSYALFQLALRVYFHAVLPPSIRPTFVWARDAWRDPQFWLSGSPESLWYLPHSEFNAIAHQSLLPALESLAGVFNNLVTTFPISAAAAFLLLINWGGHHRVLIGALRKRFGRWGLGVHLLIIVCALAAIAKPLIYAAPQWIASHGAALDAEWLWFQWSPVLAWLSFLFEYLFGVCIQIYLILMAYFWVRGLSFTHHDLLDFSIRRLPYVFKWAAIVMLLSTLCIDGPLILKNFPLFAPWFPEDDLFHSHLQVARATLAVFLLSSASMQITLTLHNESWRQAWRDHVRFLSRHLGVFIWYLLIAGIHFFFLHLCDQSFRSALGEGTALWVAWILLFPWLAGMVSAWLLSSWVCLFKRCANSALDPVHCPPRQ